MKCVFWSDLDADQREALLRRPVQVGSMTRSARVRDIIASVRNEGDVALKRLTAELDGCELDELAVPDADFEAAEPALPPRLRKAITEAMARIEVFHRAAAPQSVRVETAPGVVCERVPRAIPRVGLYVPAGSAPLPSTALMLGVPAMIAGCRDVVLCTPPDKSGSIDAAVLHAARLCGITRVFRLGGAQAIAAMALGTTSVPRCDKLFGPGNAWVTEAKQQVSSVPGGPAIDMPAGPSEVLVIADSDADPVLAAADLLSQAEHGPDSQVLLVTDTMQLAERVGEELLRQIDALPRAAIARQAMRNSCAICVDNLRTAIEISNRYAPEHLILNVRDPRSFLPQVENAGSVFLGPWSPETAGDYCSGPNHVLPTYGHARAWSGVSVSSFMKQITVQELSADGLRGIAECAMILAEAEGLHAHARAVSLRLTAMEATA